MMEPQKSSNGKNKNHLPSLHYCVPNVNLPLFHILKPPFLPLPPTEKTHPPPLGHEIPHLLAPLGKAPFLGHEIRVLKEVEVEKKPGGDLNKRKKIIRNTVKHGVFEVKLLCLVQR